MDMHQKGEVSLIAIGGLVPHRASFSHVRTSLVLSGKGELPRVIGIGDHRFPMVLPVPAKDFLRPPTSCNAE